MGSRHAGKWIALCAILLTIPLVAATLAAVRETGTALAHARLELDGLDRIAALRRLFVAVSTARSERYHVRAAVTAPDDQRAIDVAIARLDADENRLPLAGEAWRAVKAAWRRGGAGDERDLIDALLRSFLRVADRAALTTDPESAGIDLADAATSRFPDAVERLQRAELILYHAIRTGRITLDDRLTLASARAEAAGILRFGFDDVVEAELLDPGVAHATEAIRVDAAARTRFFLDGLTRFARTGTAKPAVLDAIDAAAHDSIGSLGDLHAALGPVHEELVRARVADLERRRLLNVVPGSLGIVAILLLAVQLARNVANRAELSRMRREAERFATEARFRTVFDGAALGIVVLDRAGILREANPAFDAMLGYGPRRLIGNALGSLTDREDRPATLARFEELREGTCARYTYQKRYVRCDGSPMWADVVVSRLDDGDPSGWFAIAMIEDVTERRRIEQQLRYDATHDGLTGLANRSLFVERLESVLGTATDATAAVLFIDLDHFKIVNDSLGHAAGDRLLCAVARRLEQFAGPKDTVARFGGDEFAVLFADLAHVADLTRRVRQIQDCVAEPLEIDGRSVYTSASIGVAPLAARYRGAEDVLRDADTAMYRAKADGRARVALFDAAMHDGAMRRLQLTSDLRGAIERDELRLVYQPIVKLADRRIVGYEALMRWQHPVDGLLAPDLFIPIAAESGLLVSMGRWAIDEACRQLADYRTRERRNLSMHVNLSVQEIMQTDCASYIEGRLIAHGIPAQALIVEITENAILESTRTSDAFLKRLRAIGVGICVDDFGVGYSSLRYLHRFPISGLKIDRSFVNDGDDDLASEPIVRMLLELARTLGLDVVAEGVETERQSAALEVLGCLYGQGYLYAMPQHAPVCVS